MGDNGLAFILYNIIRVELENSGVKNINNAIGWVDRNRSKLTGGCNVGSLFVWSDTNQGHGFWSEINKQTEEKINLLYKFWVGGRT